MDFHVQHSYALIAKNKSYGYTAMPTKLQLQLQLVGISPVIDHGFWCCFPLVGVPCFPCSCASSDVVLWSGGVPASFVSGPCGLVLRGGPFVLWPVRVALCCVLLCCTCVVVLVPLSSRGEREGRREGGGIHRYLIACSLIS